MSQCAIALKPLLLRPVVWTQSLGWLLGLALIGGAALGQAPADQTPLTTSGDLAAPVAPAPEAVAPAPVAQEGGYIDRTEDYNLGATQRETMPVITPSIINAPENRGAFTAKELERLTQPPVAATAPAAKAWHGEERVSAAPVQVGPVSFSSRGVSWDSEGGGSSQAYVSESVPASAPTIGGEYSTVKAFYNRTIRPLGRVGNGNLRLIFPLAIPAPITSLFGWRMHPISGTARMHTGTDIGAPLGTPVLAALTGRVIMADFFGGYGVSVALEHTNGTQQTLYAHLSEIFVKPGDVVKQGTVIGRVGSTGASTGPHLHFEFRQQTEQGWMAMDSGLLLETAMAELVKSLKVAQTGKAVGAQAN
jgi:murein DD-endopeptidase MepM/ murein hydrolase activator NlpD